MASLKKIREAAVHAATLQAQADSAESKPVREQSSRKAKDLWAGIGEFFKARSARDSFHLGEWFEECFGYDAYKRCRSDRENGPGLARRFMESAAVTTAAFQNVTQQYAYTTVLEAYNLPEIVFTKLIPVRPTTLVNERIPGISHIGDEALVVGEKEDFPVVGVSENWIDTPPCRKRGFVVAATWEAMFYDRTNQLGEMLNQHSKWLAVNHEKRAIAAIIDAGESTTNGEYRYRWKGNTIATYGDNSGTHTWDNLSASTPLTDYTSLNTAWLLLSAMTDPYTGEPISVEPKDLIIPPALMLTAEFARSGTVRRTAPGYATSGNPAGTEIPNPVQMLGQFTPRSSQLLKAATGSDTTWYIGDIARALVYMENLAPEVLAAPAGNEAEFTQDVVYRVRVKEVGTFATVEPRALVKCTG